MATAESLAMEREGFPRVLLVPPKPLHQSLRPLSPEILLQRIAETPGHVAQLLAKAFQAQRSNSEKALPRIPQLPQQLAQGALQVFQPIRREFGAKCAPHVTAWRKKQLGRSVEFWARALAVYSSYKVCQTKASLAKTKEEQERIWEEQHEDAAERVYSLCTDLGGFFLKAGQFFSKPDIAPAAWVRKLSRLQDSVPAESFSEIQRVIDAELGGKSIGEVFEWVEEHPLGSASIAQVHKGKLRGSGKGEWVAVKVQRAGVEPLMFMDISNIRRFGAFLQKYELPFDLLSVVEELESQIRNEFDFRLEAAAMDRIGASLRTAGKSRRALSPMPKAGGETSPLTGGTAAGAPSARGSRRERGKEKERGREKEKEREKEKGRDSGRPGADESPIVVPKSVPGLVSKHLLVMEFVDGVQILRMPEEIRKRGMDPNGPLARRAKAKILKDLMLSFGQMMLRDGEFQADPHPGNILICPGPKVALLDYGQIKAVSNEDRVALAHLILAAASADPFQIERAMKLAGFETSKTAQEDPHSFVRMGVIMWDTKSSPGLTSSNPFSEESTLKSNSLNKFPRELFFALKAMQFLRGLATAMEVNISAAEMWSPMALQVVKENAGVP